MEEEADAAESTTTAETLNESIKLIARKVIRRISRSSEPVDEPTSSTDAGGGRLLTNVRAG